MNFTKQKVVRFSHCDPAGIVFYPRYVELCRERVRFSLKLVLVSLDTMRAVPIDDAWRERFG